MPKAIQIAILTIVRRADVNGDFWQKAQTKRQSTNLIMHYSGVRRQYFFIVSKEDKINVQQHGVVDALTGCKGL